MPQLSVEVVEVAERARQEEVFPNIAKRSLDLALRLGPIGTACWDESRSDARDNKRTVIDNTLCLAFADTACRLHPIVQDLARNAPNRLEGGDMATQHGRQVLMHDEARPDEAAVAEHHGKQSDDPRRRRFIGEHDMKPGKIDLRLLARRRLEANLEPLLARWSNVT